MLATIVFILFVRRLAKMQDDAADEFERQTVTAGDYTIFVRELPLDAREPEDVARFFERVAASDEMRPFFEPEADGAAPRDPRVAEVMTHFEGCALMTEACARRGKDYVVQQRLHAQLRSIADSDRLLDARIAALAAPGGGGACCAGLRGCLLYTSPSPRDS